MRTLPLNPSSLISLLLFFGFLFLYGSMSAPGLDWGDAAEMQLAAWTAGLSHPTGYPLMIMLGWLWTHLLALFGIAPTRSMTLFSVTAGAATVAAMVPMMQALFRRTKLELSQRDSILLATLGAIFFGFSYTFWAQALRAEVYTLNALFLVLLLWGLWAEGAKKRLYSLALFYGIALSHHRTMILWAPGLVLWYWLECQPMIRRGRACPCPSDGETVSGGKPRPCPSDGETVSGGGGKPRPCPSDGETVSGGGGKPRPYVLLMLIALPQIVYLYIAWRGPLTAYLHQSLAEGQALTLYDGSLRAFLDHILGTVFAAELGLQQTLWERMAGVWELAKLNLGQMSRWVGGLFILYSLLGSAQSKRKSVLPLSDCLLLLSGGLGTLLFGLFYAIGDVEVMFIAFWLVLIMLIFTGSGIFLLDLNQIGHKLWAMTAHVLIFLLIAGILVAQFLAGPSSRAKLESPRRLVNELMLANPPANAILITNDRNEMVPFWYAQFAEGQRNDLLALFPLITTQAEHSHVNDLVEWALKWGRPVFLTKAMPGLGLRYDYEPYAGSLVRVHSLATMPTQPVLQSELAPELSLVGWDQGAGAIKAGQAVTLSLALQLNQPMTHDLSFSLQLFATDGTAITQQDIGPDPFYPSTDWPVGEPLRLQIALTIPAETAPGTYEWRLSSYVLQPLENFLPIGQQVVIGRFELIE